MRSGWKALLACCATALAVAVVGSGCDSKQEEKAKTDSALKPLPPPSSPGAPSDQPAKGKRTTTGGASASGAGSQ